MNKEELIAGLEFSRFHELSINETKTLIPFIKKTQSYLEVAKQLGVNHKSLYHSVQRLRFKRILTLQGKDGKKDIYEFNPESLKVIKIVKPKVADSPVALRISNAPEATIGKTL